MSWDRLTEQARHAVLVAQQEAEALNDNCVSTEHLLLGALWNRDGLACRVLNELGVGAEAVIIDVRSCLKQGPGRGTADMQITSRGKRALYMAVIQAEMLEDRFVGTEHLLLGLIREAEERSSLAIRLVPRVTGLAHLTLRKLGIRSERAQLAVRVIRGDGLLRSVEKCETPDTLLRPAASEGSSIPGELLRPAPSAIDQE